MTPAEELIASRKGAYLAVFDPSGAQTDKVLDDLAKFCRANKSTFHTDARAHALMEGRREVYLRIREHLDLTNEQLFILYGAPI